MRLTRLAPPSPRQIRELVIDDPGSVVGGCLVLARDVPVPGIGILDLLVAEPAGRLACISFHEEAGTSELAEAVARWDWAVRHLPALRALGGLTGQFDPTLAPRLVLIAAAVTEAARALAGHMAGPSIEMLRASLVTLGDSSALLLEPVPPLAPAPAPEASVDGELGALPPGSERSLIRRVVEQLRETARFVPITGGVDVVSDGQRLGTLVSTPQGVEARRADGRVHAVATDEDCREAARLLGQSAAPRVARAVAVPLTSDEIHELERGLGAPPVAAPAPGPCSVVEN